MLDSAAWPRHFSVMANPVISKIETLETLLRALTDTAYSVLCESNGLEDAPKFFEAAIVALNTAYTDAKDYFEPVEAAKRRKWADACATASYIIDRLNEDRAAGTKHPNMIDSHLHRNIADAINGTLLQTAEDRVAGVRPRTMADTISDLIKGGTLVNWR